MVFMTHLPAQKSRHRCDAFTLAANFEQEMTVRLQDKVASIFDQIPPQLSKHEKKFRLSALKPGAKYRDWDDAFFWLKDARVVNICYNSTEPNIGLKMNEDRTTLKCYMNDTGLLISHAFDEKGIVSSEIYQKLHQTGSLPYTYHMIHICLPECLHGPAHHFQSL